MPIFTKRARIITVKERRGRPKEINPEFLCERVTMLRNIFVKVLSKADWIKMHRPMARPRDDEEEGKRRREYADLLNSLGCGEVAHCDPDNDLDYPARILKWQYVEGLMQSPNSYGKEMRPIRKGIAAISEKRFEYARKLAFFLVAGQAGTSSEYLKKVCRSYTPEAASQNSADDSQ
jgi:hypothetical protein